MKVNPTRDPDYLRRWMLRPSFLRRMGDDQSLDFESAFTAILKTDTRFFSVTDGDRELGCIIFYPWNRRFELHLCLATWWTKTRIAVRLAIEQMRGTADAIIASYPAERRSVDRLLDDIGFPYGTTVDGRRLRELPL